MPYKLHNLIKVDLKTNICRKHTFMNGNNSNKFSFKTIMARSNVTITLFRFTLVSLPTTSNY
jgi:hypothetical protein